MGNKHGLLSFIAGLAAIILLSGCGQSLHRGMVGNTYVSTARPAISLSVKDMPLMLAGRGICNMEWTGMMGGLPVQVWLAVYGQGGLDPMAITAQAQLPTGWVWDGIMRQPFSVDDSVEVFNGVNYQGCTYIINSANDPFGLLAPATQPDGQPQLWIARTYMARYNFNNDKIILQYREPLPSDITSLTALPLGRGDYLLAFAERARSCFIVAAPPANAAEATDGYANEIQWEKMGQNFLGSVSRNEALFTR